MRGGGEKERTSHYFSQPYFNLGDRHQENEKGLTKGGVGSKAKQLEDREEILSERSLVGAGFLKRRGKEVGNSKMGSIL